MSIGELKDVHASRILCFHAPSIAHKRLISQKSQIFQLFAFTNMRFILYTRIKDRAQGVPEYSIYKEFVLCTILVLT